jgi:hypothetical protein
VLSSSINANIAIKSDIKESSHIQTKNDTRNRAKLTIPNHGNDHKNKNKIIPQNTHTTKTLIKFLKKV